MIAMHEANSRTSSTVHGMSRPMTVANSRNLYRYCIDARQHHAGHLLSLQSWCEVERRAATHQTPRTYSLVVGVSNVSCVLAIITGQLAYLTKPAVDRALCGPRPVARLEDLQPCGVVRGGRVPIGGRLPIGALRQVGRAPKHDPVVVHVAPHLHMREFRLDSLSRDVRHVDRGQKSVLAEEPLSVSIDSTLHAFRQSYIGALLELRMQALKAVWPGEGILQGCQHAGSQLHAAA